MLNLQAAASAIGVNRKTVEEWIAAGAPGEKVGTAWKLNLPDLIRWRIERERSNTLKEISSADISEMKRRREIAETLKVEAEAAKVTGDAISIAEVEAGWAAMVGAARAKLLGIGAKLGPELALLDDATECQDAVDAAIREAAEELSLNVQFDAECEGEASASAAEGDGPVGATAEADRKRVGRPRKTA